jgi:uncharacterized protein
MDFLKPLAPMLMLLSLAAMPSKAQPMHPAPAQTLQLAVQADVRSAPDMATISAGVMTMASTAQAAMANNAKQMTAMMAALKKAGIADRDIQTSGINLNPQLRYVENQPPQLTGYQANNTVEVRVKALDKIGATLDALVAQGANQINGPTFAVQNPEALLDQARADAVRQGMARAEVYAKAAGLKVTRLISIAEGGMIATPMPMMRQSAMAMDAGATPVAPGQVGLSASISMLFELGR